MAHGLGRGAAALACDNRLAAGASRHEAVDTDGRCRRTAVKRLGGGPRGVCRDDGACQRPSMVILTRATPLAVRPMTWAAALERSMMRPAMKGPRSLMRTSTLRPLAKCVTRTRVPNGNVRCAAVRALGLKRAPEATICPCL